MVSYHSGSFSFRMSHSEEMISKKTKSVQSVYSTNLNSTKLLEEANKTLLKLKEDKNLLRKKSKKKENYENKNANIDYCTTHTEEDNFATHQLKSNKEKRMCRKLSCCENKDDDIYEQKKPKKKKYDTASQKCFADNTTSEDLLPETEGKRKKERHRNKLRKNSKKTENYENKNANIDYCTTPTEEDNFATHQLKSNKEKRMCIKLSCCENKDDIYEQKKPKKQKKKYDTTSQKCFADNTTLEDLLPETKGKRKKERHRYKLRNKSKKTENYENKNANIDYCTTPTEKDNFATHQLKSNKEKQMCSKLSCCENQDDDIYEQKKPKKQKKKYDTASQKCFADNTTSEDPLPETKGKRKKETHSYTDKYNCPRYCKCALKQIKRQTTCSEVQEDDLYEHEASSKKNKKEYKDTASQKCFADNTTSEDPLPLWVTETKRKKKKKTQSYSSDKVSCPHCCKCVSKQIKRHASCSEGQEDDVYEHEVSPKKKKKKYNDSVSQKCSAGNTNSEDPLPLWVTVTKGKRKKEKHYSSDKVDCSPCSKYVSKKNSTEISTNDGTNAFSGPPSEMHNENYTSNEIESALEKVKNTTAYKQVKIKKSKHTSNIMLGEGTQQSDDVSEKSQKKKKKKKMEKDCYTRESALSAVECISEKKKLNKYKPCSEKYEVNDCESTSVRREKTSLEGHCNFGEKKKRKKHKHSLNFNENWEEKEEHNQCHSYCENETSPEISKQKSDEQNSHDNTEEYKKKFKGKSQINSELSDCHDESNCSPELTSAIGNLKEPKKTKEKSARISDKTQVNLGETMVTISPLHGTNIKNSTKIADFGLSPIFRLLSSQSEYRNAEHVCKTCCKSKPHTDISNGERTENEIDVSYIVVKTEPDIIKQVIEDVDMRVKDEQISDIKKDLQNDLSTNYVARTFDNVRGMASHETLIDNIPVVVVKEEQVKSDSGQNEYSTDINFNTSGIRVCNIVNGNPETDCDTPFHNIYDDKITVKEELVNFINMYDYQNHD